MSTTLTPPPLPPVAGPPDPEPQTPGTRASSKVIAILVMALGGALILGTIGTTVISTVAAASIQTTGRSLAVDDVDALDVDLAAGTLVVEFADVTEAELEVTGSFGADQWTLRTDGGTLVVASPDWHFGTPWLFGNGRATLRLPSSLEGLDADFGLGAGDLTADGDFGELGLDLGAGRASLAGSADVLTADVSAGRADLDLADVGSADITVSAGALVGRLTGDQPDAITLEVSAGSADLTVPEGDYDVSSDVSAGQFDNRVGSTPGASSTVRVDVSAGQAVLRAG
ncbi:hypothetical protein [Microbacterium sp. P5_E9]